MTYSYHLKRRTAFLTPSEDTVRLVLSLPVYLIFHYDLLLFDPNTADFVTVIISAQMHCLIKRKTGSVFILSSSITALKPSGITRHRFPSIPPPVIWAMP